MSRKCMNSQCFWSVFGVPWGTKSYEGLIKMGRLLRAIFGQKSEKWHPKRHPKIDVEKASKKRKKTSKVMLTLGQKSRKNRWIFWKVVFKKIAIIAGPFAKYQGSASQKSINNQRKNQEKTVRKNDRKTHEKTWKIMNIKIFIFKNTLLCDYWELHVHILWCNNLNYLVKEKIIKNKTLKVAKTHKSHFSLRRIFCRVLKG